MDRDEISKLCGRLNLDDSNGLVVTETGSVSKDAGSEKKNEPFAKYDPYMRISAPLTSYKEKESRYANFLPLRDIGQSSSSHQNTPGFESRGQSGSDNDNGAWIGMARCHDPTLLGVQQMQLITEVSGAKLSSPALARASNINVESIPCSVAEALPVGVIDMIALTGDYPPIKENSRPWDQKSNQTTTALDDFSKQVTVVSPSQPQYVKVISEDFANLKGK
ncbi:hypothetical protein TorRG33x02_193160 [Trema orientale]|uniref:Uncharacterized protein n=1 Tax=Trema orientale TaxID=63057 RepID=A0A2P5EH89_TREOI|nr:hypothetical protein TorRG33x02_193160 [Trema orientale]